MILLPLQNVLSIQPQQTRVVAVTIFLVTATTATVVVTIQIVVVTIEIVTTTLCFAEAILTKRLVEATKSFST